MSRLVATYEEQSAVTILLVLLSACSYSCKTLCPLTEAPLVPLLLLPLLSQQYLLISIHLLFLFLFSCDSSSLCTSILCSVKAVWALLNMRRTTTRRLKEGKSNIERALSLCSLPTRISASGPHLTFPQSESLCSSSTSSRPQSSRFLSSVLISFQNVYG